MSARKMLLDRVANRETYTINCLSNVIVLRIRLLLVPGKSPLYGKEKKFKKRDIIIMACGFNVT